MKARDEATIQAIQGQFESWNATRGSWLFLMTAQKYLARAYWMTPNFREGHEMRLSKSVL